MAESADVSEVVQRIEENIGDELALIPSHIRRYGTTNFFKRSFAYLFGWQTNGIPIKLVATGAGSLKVASTGAGVELYERNPTSDANGFIVIVAAAVETETFSTTMSGFDVWAQDNSIYVELQKADATWMAKVMLQGGLNEVWGDDIVVKAIRFSNVDVSGANDGKYQVIGKK